MDRGVYNKEVVVTKDQGLIKGYHFPIWYARPLVGWM